MVVVLSSHTVSTGINYHHIMTGSVFISSIAEIKCTNLKNTTMHYVGLTYLRKMMWATNQTQFSCVRLLIWKPIECLNSAILFGNCGCQFPWWALARRGSSYACFAFSYASFHPLDWNLLSVGDVSSCWQWLGRSECLRVLGCFGVELFTFQIKC
jgi:hypothetical protein